MKQAILRKAYPKPDAVAFRGVVFGFSLVKAEFGPFKLFRQTPAHNPLARDELREKHTTKGYHLGYIAVFWLLPNEEQRAQILP